MAEKYEWDDGEEAGEWTKELKHSWDDNEEVGEWTKELKYSWDDNEEVGEWAISNKGVSYENSQEQKNNHELTLDEEIADIFLLAIGKLIEHNKKRVEVIQRLRATSEMTRYYQDKINDLTEYIEELTVDCETVRASPTEETVDQIRLKKYSY